MPIEYNDKLSAELQVNTEESIAALLFDKYGLSEVKGQKAARAILLKVVAVMRPDLIRKPCPYCAGNCHNEPENSDGVCDSFAMDDGGFRDFPTL